MRKSMIVEIKQRRKPQNTKRNETSPETHDTLQKNPISAYPHERRPNSDKEGTDWGKGAGGLVWVVKPRGNDSVEMLPPE